MSTTLKNIENLLLSNAPDCTTVADCVAKLGTPSISVAVLENGTTTSACYSTIGDDPDTIFQACSLSKPVASLAAMALVDQGLLTVDSTVKDLLPEETLRALTEDSPKSQHSMVENITVKQLMSHSAGLSVHGFGGYSKLDKLPASANDILRGQYPVNNLRVRLELFPGTTASYSGGGITVLQIILEVLTKKDFPTLMQDLVLQPLGMSRSFYGPLPVSEKNAAKAYHTGYTPCSSEHHIEPELAAAGLWTTPTDLLKAIQAVQQSLEKDGFLKKKTAELLLTKTHDDGNALSWFIDDTTGFYHTGANDPGFRCMFYGFAELGMNKKVEKGEEEKPALTAPKHSGIAVMVNSAEGYEACQRFFLAAGYLNKWPASKWLSNPRLPLWDDKAPIGEKWSGYQGTWTDKLGNKFKLEKEGNDGKLSLWFNSAGSARLLPAAAPGAIRDNGDVTLFVLEGLSMLLKLKEEDGKKVLALVNTSDQDITDLTLSSD